MSDPADIRGWQRLGAQVTTSGKLEPGDPARLAAIGVCQVINLALGDHPEALAGEGALLGAHGIGYTHIPVPFDAPDKTHYAAFCAALDRSVGPVHVHCIMNYRVSAFFYLRNREQGMAEEEARRIMAAQWDPIANDRPETRVWAEFIAR
jgi:protein tyrosine phosphatase (PTP) superfamily phosphohydrolase (DUF442 family)